MFVFKVAYVLEKKERVTKQLSANYSIFVSKEDNAYIENYGVQVVE